MTEETLDDKVVIYSDYLCPFCYLGKESLETYLESADAAPQVEWRPFDIQGHKRGSDGEIREDVDDGKDEAYFDRVRENVERLKEEFGVEMTFDLPDGIDSWNAQKVALAVERSHDPETFRSFHEALFQALWRDGRDIGDPEVLTDIAADHGIDPDAVRDAVDDASLDETLAEKFAEARQMGIRGIPTFIYGEKATQGALPPQHFARLFDPE